MAFRGSPGGWGHEVPECFEILRGGPSPGVAGQGRRAMHWTVEAAGSLKLSWDGGGIVCTVSSSLGGGAGGVDIVSFLSRGVPLLKRTSLLRVQDGEKMTAYGACL